MTAGDRATTRRAMVILSFLVAASLLGYLAVMAWRSHQEWNTCDIELPNEEIRELVVNGIRERGLGKYFTDDGAGLKPEDGVWSVRAPTYKLAKDAESEYEMTKYEVQVRFGEIKIWALVSPCAHINMMGRGELYK